MKHGKDQMKKIIITGILLLGLLGSLMACGREAGEPEKTSGVTETAEVSSAAKSEEEDKAPSLKDGTYEIEFTFTGGSGRAYINSPAKVTVAGDKMEAELIWSSKNYIYMLVDDVKYEPVNQGGNSAFLVPVVLDQDMKVIGCTTAMSEPHEIEYTLHFDSKTAK